MRHNSACVAFRGEVLPVTTLAPPVSAEPARFNWVPLGFACAGMAPSILVTMPPTPAVMDPIDGGPESPPSTLVVMAPDEPSLSNELLDVAVNLSPPFSLSFRFDEDLLTNRLSLSLSDKRRLSRALFGPLPLLVAEAVGVEAV